MTTLMISAARVKNIPGATVIKNVIAGETLSARTEAAADEIQAVVPVNLIKSLRPAQSLSPGLFKVYGLFIVDNGLVTVADHFSINGAVYRKFNILGQKMEGPASLFTDDFSGYQKPGAGNGTVWFPKAYGGKLRKRASRRNHSPYPAEIQLAPKFLELR